MQFQAPSRRRATSPSPIGRFECLEIRALLSAATCNIVPEPAHVSVMNLDTDETIALSARKKAPGPLTGSWDVDTEIGEIHVDSVQKNKKVKGEIDLSGVDLENLLDNIPPEAIPTLPTVEFVGKFKQGVLSAKFQTTIDVPVLGKLNVTGQFTGQLDVLAGTIAGHVTVAVNGTPFLDQDFTADLPEMPLSASAAEALDAVHSRGIPGGHDVSGTYPIESGYLAPGSVVVTQKGLQLHGVLSSDVLESGEFDAQFKKAKSKKAKGFVQLDFDDSPLLEGKFQIKFYFDKADGSVDHYWFKYSKLRPVDM